MAACPGTANRVRNGARRAWTNGVRRGIAAQSPTKAATGTATEAGRGALVCIGVHQNTSERLSRCRKARSVRNPFAAVRTQGLAAVEASYRFTACVKHHKIAPRAKYCQTPPAGLKIPRLPLRAGLPRPNRRSKRAANTPQRRPRLRPALRQAPLRPPVPTTMRPVMIMGMVMSMSTGMSTGMTDKLLAVNTPA